MIFITGPLFSGKKDMAKALMQWDDEALSKNAVWDVQDLVSQNVDLQTLSETLTQKKVVIATEVGAGVVPADPKERAQREAAGRLCCLLAQKADTVIRVFCGIPAILKGEASL